MSLPLRAGPSGPYLGETPGTGDAGRGVFAALAGTFFYSGMYNVRGFGARGDGVTDDTAACQAAIAACAAAGGGVVYFPAGRYKLTTTLTSTSSVTLVGDGIGKTTLYMPAANFTNTTIGAHNGTSLGIDCSGQLVAPFTAITKVGL